MGPRQCGKTTLARLYADQIYENKADVHYFNLEHPSDLNALSSPALTLESLNGLIIIDEIQRRPDLFPYLRYLSDIGLTPFWLKEVEDLKKHWQRGGFAKSHLASSRTASERWRFDYITTFLERDLGNIGFAANPSLMRRLGTMAHYHGQTVNYCALERSFINPGVHFFLLQFLNTLKINLRPFYWDHLSIQLFFS